MKDNGKMISTMDMVYIIIQMERNMKDNRKMISTMDMVYFIIQMEILHMKDN